MKRNETHIILLLFLPSMTNRRLCDVVRPHHGFIMIITPGAITGNVIVLISRKVRTYDIFFVR